MIWVILIVVVAPFVWLVVDTYIDSAADGFAARSLDALGGGTTRFLLTYALPVGIVVGGLYALHLMRAAEGWFWSGFLG